MSAGKTLNKTVLAFALAIQLVVVGVLLAARAGGVVEPEPFLSFDVEAVDSLTIGNDESSVRIVKADDAWQLPDSVPADASKVESVLEKLANVSGGWPVATSASTAERFEVTEGHHQRHLTLHAGEDVVADIYLGTSPGYRKAHARRVDDDDVYAITFSNYEAGVKASDWLDKSLLRPRGALAAIRREDAFELTKGEDGGWTAAADAVLDAGKTETLAGRFTGLSVLGVSDAALPDAPTAAFALTDDEGVQTLSLYRLAEDDYAIASDRVPGSYELSSYTAEKMVLTLDDLAPDAPEDEEPEDDSESAEAAQ